MDISEMLRTLGALYLGLYIRAEILERENTRLGVEIAELKRKYEPPPTPSPTPETEVGPLGTTEQQKEDKA
jgi:hypothetical protein